MPTTESAAPTTSILRDPVYSTSRTILMPDSTTTMITTSSANPTRHDKNVVTKPPRRGPTAAAMAADAPTNAYAFLRAGPSKLPWMSDCIAGRRSDAPRPPMIAQKITTAVRLCARVIARAPTA